MSLTFWSLSIIDCVDLWGRSPSHRISLQCWKTFLLNGLPSFFALSVHNVGWIWISGLKMPEMPRIAFCVCLCVPNVRVFLCKWMKNFKFSSSTNHARLWLLYIFESVINLAGLFPHTPLTYRERRRIPISFLEFMDSDWKSHWNSNEYLSYVCRLLWLRVYQHNEYHFSSPCCALELYIMFYSSGKPLWLIQLLETLI